MAKNRIDGEGTVYPLNNGRWVAAISLTDANGKRRRRTKTARRRSDALALLEDLKEEQRRGLSGLSENPKLATYLSHWLESLATRSAVNTVALNRNAIDKHIVPALGNVRLEKLTPMQVKGMVTGWEKAKLGVRTQQVALSVLHHALQEAVHLGTLRTNPASKVKPPKGDRKEIDPFEADEVAAILNAAKAHPMDYAGIVLLFSCGLRFGEMAGLPPRCVDLKEGAIRIEQQATTDAGSGCLVIGPPKTKRSRRTIHLTPLALEALTDHMAQNVALGRAGEDLVFLGARGGVLRHKNWTSRVWNKCLAEAGVRQRPPHHARHTYATLSLSAGVPVHVVSAVLGHARASITLDTYAHYLPSQQKTATEAIARLIG